VLKIDLLLGELKRTGQCSANARVVILKDLLELQQKAASSGKSCKVKKLAIARLEKKTQEPNSS
jgi:hypothetical protein